MAGGGGTATQVDAIPFTSSASNSISPLENWNLAALSKLVGEIVRVFIPSTNAVEGPKKACPFEVVLNTLTFAPAVGSEVTFIVYVWADWLLAPSLISEAVRT